MICKLCAWGADVLSSDDGVTVEAAYAASEAHGLCPGCDCHHKGITIPGIIKTLGGWVPSRCSACYRRHALTPVGGVIHWHKIDTPKASNGYNRYPRCPGSGKPELVKAIASGAISSWRPPTGG